MEFIKNEVYESAGGIYICTEVHETHAILESLSRNPGHRTVAFKDEPSDEYWLANDYRINSILTRCQDRIKEVEDDLKHLREREGLLDAARRVVEARDNSNQ